MNLCTVCLMVKTDNSFYKDFRRKCGLRRECKVCTLNLHREWQRKNPELYKAHYTRSNRKSGRSKHLKYTYGITQQEYDILVEKQNNLCAICRESEKRHKYLLVDHNHTNNTIRGLLCDNCNKGLGHFKDNEKLLINAFNYLKKQYVTS